MELHEYMESRGIARESIAAEQEKTRERIEAYKLAQIRKARHAEQVRRKSRRKACRKH